MELTPSGGHLVILSDMHEEMSVEETPEPVATAATNPSAVADLRFDAAATTSASLELNAVPCVTAIEVHAHARLVGAVLRVAIDGEPPESAVVFSRGLETIDAGTSLAVDALGLELPAGLLKRSSEREPLDLVATLVDGANGGRALATARHRIVVVPASHWCGTQNTCESLAAFVTPNTPAIAEILRDVSARVQKSTGSGALDARAGVDAENGAVQARAASSVP